MDDEDLCQILIRREGQTYLFSFKRSQSDKVLELAAEYLENPELDFNNKDFIHVFEILQAGLPIGYQKKNYKT